jgi:hypothetical protein
MFVSDDEKNMTLLLFKISVYLYVQVSVCLSACLYEGGPKNNRNLNVAREIEVVARCAARCLELTQYSSSLPRRRLPEYCVYSRQLAAHRATTFSSHATFKFRLFLGPSSYIPHATNKSRMIRCL